MSRLEAGCFELPDLQFVKINHSDFSHLQYTESIFPSDVSDVTLLVPKGSKEYYSNFYPWKNFQSIEEFEMTDDDHDFTAYSLTQDVVMEENPLHDNDSLSFRCNRDGILGGNLCFKSYIPAGKNLSNLAPADIDGYEFIGWEELPAYMPSEDIAVRAKYRQKDQCNIDIIKDASNVDSERIYTLDGIYVGNNVNYLQNGLYLILENNGSVRKIKK